jgi:hypothetical protein
VLLISRDLMNGQVQLPAVGLYTDVGNGHTSRRATIALRQEY